MPLKTESLVRSYMPVCTENDQTCLPNVWQKSFPALCSNHRAAIQEDTGSSLPDTMLFQRRYEIKSSWHHPLFLPAAKLSDLWEHFTVFCHISSVLSSGSSLASYHVDICISWIYLRGISDFPEMEFLGFTILAEYHILLIFGHHGFPLWKLTSQDASQFVQIWSGCHLVVIFGKFE